ncbi:hypothetical protein V6N12_071719 [Hibiscus sabdariffa]|uniref:Uncharacterized protein n=1 Tax=Hibiscus sabdariffa TaxID=183260 RepID=A0ABR2FKT5_9ROSI
MGDTLHYPGQVSLYCQKFQTSLRSMATTMVSVVIGIAFYVSSTAPVSLIRRSTGWLPPDINSGRVDNLYWILVTAGSLNFIHLLLCAKVVLSGKILKRKRKLIPSLIHNVAEETKMGGLVLYPVRILGL